MTPSVYAPPPGAILRRVPPPPPPHRPEYLPPPVASAPAPPETRPPSPGIAALTPPHARFYRVREGDSVYGIARRFNVDMAALVRINRMAPPYRINAGERLLVPDKTPERPAPGEVASAAPPPLPAPVTPQAALPGAPPVDVPPPPRASGGFEWPVHGRILSPFGKQEDGLRNDGINIGAKEGTPVRAADNGVVVYAGNELPGFGNLLILRHADGWMTAYGHNARLMVRPGQTVRRGQVVATVGHTGGVKRPQLHFEIRRKGGAVDPARFLTRAGA